MTLQDRLAEGVEQIQSLSKPKRYGILGVLWAFTVAVVTLIDGLFAALMASTIAVSFIYLLKPYVARHPDKGFIALLASLADVRRPSRYDLSLSVVGVAAIIVSEILLALIVGMLASQSTPAGHGIASTANSSPGPLILVGVFLAGAVIAPAMEELVFRNGLQKLLAFRVGDIVAIVVTSLLFASLHIPSYGGFGVPASSLALPLSVVFTGSVVFGVLYWRTQNVVVPMVSHGLFNGVVLLYMVLDPPIFG